MTLPAGYVQFAVYETFAPTTLRGKVVLVTAPDAGWVTGLPAVLAMECARIGAHLALAAETAVHQAIARDIVAYGRPVLELSGRATEMAPRATAAHYGHVDVAISLGPDEQPVAAACDLVAGQGSGCVVWLTPAEAGDRVRQRVQAMQAKLPAEVRLNGIIAALPGGPDPGPTAQELAWQAIFLASAAGAGIRGHCLQPTAARQRD